MKYTILIAIAVATIVAFSCSNERGGFLSKLLKGGSAGVPVTVETVASEERSQSTFAPASIETVEMVDVSLPDDAMIESFAVAEGESVAAGDPLARISEDEINLRLARFRADLREARNKQEKDSYVMRNRDRLLDEDRIDEEQYDAIEEQVSEDEAEVERIQTDITRIENGFDELAVRSPISGVVTKRYVAVGSMATGGNPIVTIARIDPVVAVFNISPDQSAVVRPEMKIDVIFPSLGDRRIAAKITSVGTKLNPEDGKFAVRAEIPNRDGVYKDGMRANVEIRNPETKRVFLVPEGALIRGPRAYFVFTVIDGTAHKVQVIPEQSKGGYIEIARGLKEADIVVVGGQDKIKEGTAVDIWRK